MQKNRYSSILLLLLFQFSIVGAQPLNNKETFSRADTLRGSVTPERVWWDVTHYSLQVKFDFNKRSIDGFNIISFNIVSAPQKEMQIDLQQGLDIDSVLYKSQQLPFRRDGNAYFVSVPAFSDTIKAAQVKVYYHGIPRSAIHPPWDGGVVWSKDQKGNPWISVACQGLGASVWYPCKDYQGDEPDSASLSMIVPDTLIAIANGKFREKVNNGDGTMKYTWAVTNPINNYNLVPYIGKYTHWHEDYNGEKGNLDVDFWVMEYNLEKAKNHFKQVFQMLQCFEYWFGPYPFYEDGYKLVEAPHMGMEHQSAVAYGNGYMNGYRGTDLSATGWGLKWDFIIVHESGHEWFGNNITTKDIGDMWVHEGFTNYAEAIFVDCEYGKEAGNDYVVGIRKHIRNDKPIAGPYGVNQEGSGDMYYKGGNLVHIIRQVMNNDSSFRALLREMNRSFYHQTVTGHQIEEFITHTSGIDFSKVFDQYIRTAEVPVLEYKISNNKLSYRWANTVKGFNMPVKINFGGEKWITPMLKWKKLKINSDSNNGFSVDRNFYIGLKQL